MRISIFDLIGEKAIYKSRITGYTTEIIIQDIKVYGVFINIQVVSENDVLYNIETLEIPKLSKTGG